MARSRKLRIKAPSIEATTLAMIVVGILALGCGLMLYERVARYEGSAVFFSGLALLCLGFAIAISVAIIRFIRQLLAARRQVPIAK